MLNSIIKSFVIAVLMLASHLVQAQAGFRVTTLESVENYKPGQRHTLVFEITNNTGYVQTIRPRVELPDKWTVINQGMNTTLNPDEKKLFFIGLFIPAATSPGLHLATLNLQDRFDKVIQSLELSFNIEVHHDIAVEKLVSPQYVQAGDSIEVTFEIRNKGNVKEEIRLSSRNTFEGDEIRQIDPGTILLVKVSNITNEKNYYIQQITSNLEVENMATNQSSWAYSTTKVIPTKIAAKDAYRRYPMEASAYSNSYSNNRMNMSSQYFELRGNGHLDSAENHFLNLLIRAPKQANQSRFGVTDQYSLIYKHQDKTTVFLGDHSFNLNRLGFTGRYGMGVRVDHRIGDMTLTGFYTKPRLFSFSREPIFGGKVMYRASRGLNMGISYSRTKELAQFYNYQAANSAGKTGEITAFEVNYSEKNTYIRTELAANKTENLMDYASDISVAHRVGRLNFQGNATMAGENFYGTLSNSLRFSNGLSYNLEKWNFGIGQGYSKVHERVDTTLYGARPNFENYYTSAGYRVNKHHYFDVRGSYRSRTDQSQFNLFDYRERGISYRYKYSSDYFTLNLNARYARTQNRLSENRAFRDTYGHSIGVLHKWSENLTLRGSFSHNRTNRYSRDNVVTDFFLYSGGINYNVSRALRLSGSYNSGFSPEETYRKRDFLNASMVARIGRNHQLEARVNFFVTPNTVNNQEVFAFAKYTYRFGAPLKKILKQGGVKGRVYTNDPSINLKGVQMLAVGNSVQSDAKGDFELNNLPIGANYVILDESTLPRDVIPVSQIPFNVEVSEDDKAPLDVELVRAARLRGLLVVEDAIAENLEGYLKLENELFTYYVESDKNGSFQFGRVVPGNYKLSLVRLKRANDLVSVSAQISVTANQGTNDPINFQLKLKERKIKFKNNDFRIGE